MSEWISVEDRLPDEPTRCYECGTLLSARTVLVFADGRGVLPSSVRRKWTMWDRKNNAPLDETMIFTYCNQSGEIPCVTHWMPLPEPPKC